MAVVEMMAAVHFSSRPLPSPSRIYNTHLLWQVLVHPPPLSNKREDTLIKLYTHPLTVFRDKPFPRFKVWSRCEIGKENVAVDVLRRNPRDFVQV